MKKGQVTLFVIFGILILIVSLILAYIIVNLVNNPDSDRTFNTDNIEFMITDCIKKTGSNGLNQLGQNGNYINVPDLLKYKGTSYWIYHYSNVEPFFNSSIDDFQLWFNQKFLECLDFDSFPGYEFSYNNVSSKIEYGADEVIFNVNFPINITKGDQVKTLKKFTVVSNIRYRRILEKARDIVNAHYIPKFDYLNALELVDKENFNIEYQIIDKENLVFTITEKNKIDYNDYVFKFATNLEKSNLKRTAIITEDSLDFFIPYIVYSPDRMAMLMLSNNVEITGPNGEEINNISVWTEYVNNVSRKVTNEVVHTDGKKDSSSESTFRYILDYPIYNFEPNGTKFNIPQRLTIYWDNDKIPNQGPMGMLYKGALSENKWRPINAKVNYEEHFVYGDIPGFSKYTVVDCARQTCKEAVVTGKSKPSALCMGPLLMWLIIISIIILIIALAITFGVFIGTVLGPLFGIFGTFAVGTFTVSVFGVVLVGILAISAGSVAYIVINGAGFKSGDSSVGIVPTCNQLIDVSCVASSKLEKGNGLLGGTTIPKDGSISVSGSGGNEMILTAVAKKCKKSAFKCYPCKITCRAAYK